MAFLRAGVGRGAGLMVLGLAAACALSGAGCAGERDPINQVQLGAMPKQFFVGENLQDASDDPEFYFRTTVVDVSAGAGSESLFTSSDSQPTVRIRWEVAETRLLARLSYELIDGTDGKGTSGDPRGDEPRGASGAKAPGRTTTDGQIVAAFEIKKQFDIRRDYNTTTGEENNTVVENDHDRPWNQREWIRVDWSKNLITDAYDLDAVSQMGLYGGVKWTPVAVEVQDPNSADAPVIDLDAGYFDIVNKAFASPQLIHDEEWGDFPACQLVGEFPRTSCNPSEVKMRLAFRKIADTDYEPLDFDGKKMELFGLFTNDRFGYDRKYGVVDQDWHRFASRWNIWEKSHASPVVKCATPETTPVAADPHRDANGDGTEDECESVGNGSRCDAFSQKCTLPIRERKVKPVVWHVNREYPEDLFEAGKTVMSTWNDSLRVAVLAARLAECRRTKSGGCEQTMGWPQRWSDDFVPPAGDASLAEVPDVFVLCHNPVDPKTDAPVCGKEGTSPRMGDLRYNLLTYVGSAQVQAPWGIMVDAEDPLTGEKISGSVNQYGVTLDRAAASVVDIVALLNGVTSPQAFIEGRDVADWVRAQNQKAGKADPVSAQELSDRLAAFQPSAMAPFATGAPKKGARPAQPPRARHTARMRDLQAAGKLGAGNTAIAQRLQSLRGTAVEAKLITPEIAQRAGFDPRTAQSLTKDAVARATPVGRSLPFARRGLEKRALVGHAKRHACRREAPEPDNLLGVAREAQKLFGRPDAKDPGKVVEWKDQVYGWARKKFAIGVFSHELGHSVGLRHNFAGTFDSLNYALPYWQLRTKNGSVTKACAAGNTDGASCVGPRYTDPVTDEEVTGNIGSFASSSVMDYPGDQSLDSFLMGSYDKAAVRFAYAGVADVWAGQGLSVNGLGDGKRKAYELLSFTDSPGLFGVQAMSQPASTDSKYMHYSQYAAEFGLLEGCKPDGEAPLGTRCFGPAMDVVDYRDLGDFAAVPDWAAFATQTKVIDKQGRVRRGYMFSSDEYADSGNVPSFTFDAGADAYEQVRFLETAYENRYILDAFRRGRTMFNSDGVVARTQRHYLDTMQLLSKTFAFAMVLEVDDPSKPDPALLDDGNYGPLAMGASHAFDVFTRALTRPEPGSYCSTESDTCSGTQPFGLSDYIFVADPFPLPSSTYDFQLPLGTGRYVHNDFDYSQGYWWGDYQKQVGSFYDKVWAVYYLSEAYDTFISNSKEDFLDGRYKNVSFATIYPEQVRRLYASLMTGDMTSFAPWVGSTIPAAGQLPAGDLTYPAWSKADLGTRPTTAKLVDPAYGFQEQLFGMVWGTVFFPTSWTNQFIDDARITVRAGEQVGWPAAETYTFVNPETGMTYRAHTTGTEKIYGVDHQKTVGARMLEWANELLVSAYVPDTDAKGNILLNADGTPKLKLEAGKPKVNPDYPGADGALRRYVMNLEVMRELVSTYVRPVDQPLP